MPPLRSPRTLLAAALALGICADFLFFERQLGISVPLFVLLCLLTLGRISVVEERPALLGNRWLGIAALFFALWVMLRDTELLVVLNLLASLGLLLLFVAGYRSRPLIQLSVAEVLGRSLHALGLAATAPAPLAAQSLSSLPVNRERTRWLIPISRGLLLALPVLACFGGLLVSADSVFASYVGQLLSFQLPFDPLRSLGHTIFTLLAAYCCAGALLAALQLPAQASPVEAVDLPAEGETRRLTPPPTSLQFLGCTEATTIMGAVDLLFGAFMLVQAAYFFGGIDTLDRTGMTYAEYARRGFFELLVVACLTLALLGTLALLTRREQPRQRQLFNAVGGAMILLVNGLLASAFQRMLLYEEAYGFTRLRLYTQGFMVWLGIVLLLALAALLYRRANVFSWGTGVATLVFLTTLNLLNPDALIVRQNIARYQVMGKLDAEYLATLSADAAPALSAALPTLDPEQRSILNAALARQYTQLSAEAKRDGWPAWSLARAQAQAAIKAAGVEATPPADEPGFGG